MQTQFASYHANAILTKILFLWEQWGTIEHARDVREGRMLIWSIRRFCDAFGPEEIDFFLDHEREFIFPIFCSVLKSLNLRSLVAVVKPGKIHYEMGGDHLQCARCLHHEPQLIRLLARCVSREPNRRRKNRRMFFDIFVIKTER
jgi:hypothetical protein